jgi:hypothetical protein
MEGRESSATENAIRDLSRIRERAIDGSHARVLPTAKVDRENEGGIKSMALNSLRRSRQEEPGVWGSSVGEEGETGARYRGGLER